MAARIGKDEGFSAETVLIERFNVPKQDLLKHISSYYRVEPFDVDEFEDLSGPMRKVVWDHCDQMKADMFVPVAELEGSALIAIADPRNVPLRDKIRTLFPGQSVDFRVAMEDDIRAVIDQVASEAHAGRASAHSKNVRHATSSA